MSQSQRARLPRLKTQKSFAEDSVIDLKREPVVSNEYSFDEAVAADGERPSTSLSSPGRNLDAVQSFGTTAEVSPSRSDRPKPKLRAVIKKVDSQDRFKRRLSQLRQISRFRDQHDEEGDQTKIEKAIEKAAEIKERNEDNKRNSKNIIASAQNQYDFFTKEYDAPETREIDYFKPSARRIKKKKDAKEEDIEADAATESSKLVDYIVDEDKWAMTSPVGAYYPPFRRQICQENKLYFTPSWFAVPASAKIGTEPRQLAEEGYYVGPELQIPNKTVNAMEQRLLSEAGGKKSSWFGEDGKIISSMPDLSAFPTRREIVDVGKPVPLTKFVKAVVGSTRVASENGIYQIDIDVSKILFTHHSLFPKENVLAMRLMQHYRCYLQRREENLAQNYAYRLHALKRAFQELRGERGQSAIERRQSRGPDSMVMEREQQLITEIQEVRRQRNNEEMLDTQLNQQILKIWDQLKTLRRNQGYTTTSLQLYLKRKPVNEGEDKLRWSEDLQEELAEMKFAYEQQHFLNLQNYYRNLQKYKEEKRRKRIEAAREGEEIETPKDESLETSMNAPKKPPPFDSRLKFQQISDQALRTRRSPGEPIITLVLGSSGQITALNQSPKSEQDRRKEIGKHRIKFKIYFNDLEVCQSTARPLNADFCISFQQIYNLHVFEWPRSIKLKVFEHFSGSWNALAEVCLPVPNASQIRSENGASLEEYEFSSATPFPVGTNAGVGSGSQITFDLDDCPAVILWTSGVVQSSVLWGRTKDGVSLVPPASLQETIEELHHISPKNIGAIEELQEMLESNKLDPNDPVNSGLLSVLKDLSGAGDELKTRQFDTFSLDPPELELISEAEFLANPRFRLLELRNNQVAEFRNMKMIPSRVRELPPNIFKEYEQRLAKEKEKMEVKDMDSYRIAVNKYLAQIREQVYQRIMTAQRTKSLNDVVLEEPIPSLSTLGLFLFEDPGRPLKPPRRERKKIAGQNLSDVQVKLLVNLVRAYNVPVRSKRPGEYAQKSSGALFEVPSDVEPFVEVSFQRQTARTSTLHTSAPTWNQQLFLNFSPPNNDFSARNLQSITDVVYFNLYDNVTTDLPKDNRNGESTIHQQIEKRWLGSFSVPFSCIYASGRVYGTFRVNAPPVLLGYTIDSSDSAKSQHAYLQIFIAIEPPIQPPDPIRGKFESIESPTLLAYADRWLRNLQAQFEGRKFCPLVIDMNGRSVFLCRYLKAIPPPPEIEEAVCQDPRNGLNVACRIISFIPFVSDITMFPGLADIWGTTDQFLTMLCGDEEEHALLLYCWLAGLNLNPYLVLGNGTPEGPRAAYILAQPGIGKETRLYNASTAVSYSVKDPVCPLKSVGTIANSDNLWANIQDSDHPAAISFDVNNSKFWMPFFNKGFPNPGLSSVQPDQLTYTEPERETVVQLQERLERTVKENLMAWRPHQITRFNRFAIQTLRQLLANLETEYWTGDHERQHQHELQEIMSTYKMCGFPLNLGFSSTEKVLNAVFATDVHNNYHPDVEFALAVHVHPYFNGILSVWIYVASLIRNR